MTTTRRFTVVAVLVCLVIAGLAGGYFLSANQPRLPEDSFRLTVTDIFAQGDDRVTRLVIETATDNAVETSYENPFGYGRSAWYTMERSADGRSYRKQITVLVSRVTSFDKDKDIVKVIVGQGSSAYLVPRDQPIETTFDLTARDGLYKLDSPLVIGRQSGGNLALVVGQSLKKRLDEPASR